MKGNMKCICVIGSLVLLFFMCKTIKENLLPYDPKIDDLRRRLLLVHDKASSLQFYHDKKSYTINKQKIHLCIKDENGTYYDDNMLIYASLHELAHAICNEIGHTPKFWAIFDELLLKASNTIDPKTNKPVYDKNGQIDLNYCESDYHNSE
jgi:hypothetical protein